MKISCLLLIIVVGTSTCGNPKNMTICQKKLSELVEISIYKTVQQLANTLHISIESFQVLENNGRSIKGISLYCRDQGTIKFYFDDTTDYTDAAMDEGSAVVKIKDQPIRSAEWTNSKGKKVTAKAVTLY